MPLKGSRKQAVEETSLTGSAVRIAGAEAALAPPPRSSTVFVEIRPSSVAAEVARAGSMLPAVAIDARIVDSVLDRLTPVATKVVSQSVAPGTAVPRGTAVDLVLARPGDLPGRIIPGIHEAFKVRTIGDIGQQLIEAQPTVKEIIRRKPVVTDLTEAERATVTNALAQSGVELSNVPGLDLAAAYTGLQAGYLFVS